MACSDPSGYVEPVAFYNENDPFAAAWLRELIKANLIAPGVVDERSIEDIKPDELAQYTQCHFFAGIGGWSLALRLAGWPDEKPVWTGSCPCQPFSAAGKRTGTSDERHLWPAFFHLIEQCKPSVVFGEQVEAAIRQGWLDLVQDDMEGIGYAFAAAGLPAASVGAPHLRARLYFVADSERNAAEQRRIAIKSIEGDGTSSTRSSVESRRCGVLGSGDLADSETQRSSHGGERAVLTESCEGCSDELADSTSDRCGEERADARRLVEGDSAERISARSESGGVPNFWTECDWLYCRDEKYRPVEPGTFPLAHGISNRVGKLRGYGNAIVAPLAQAFIESYLDTRLAGA